MVNRKFRLPLSVAALSMLLLPACVNSDYDLSKEINTDITIGAGGISLPLGATERINLSQFIEESDLIKLEDGQYHLRKSGEVDEVNVSIDPVHLNITPPAIDPVIVDFIPTAGTRVATGTKGMETAGAQGAETTMSLEAVVERTSELNLDEKVPDELVRLHRAFLQNGTSAKMTVRIAFPTNFPAEADRLTLQNFKIELPKFITFAEEEVRDGVLTLNESFSAKAGFVKQLTITGLDFSAMNDQTGLPTEKVDGKNYIRLTSDNRIAFGGVVKSEATAVAPDVLKNIRITPSVTIGEMTLGVVTGVVDPKIDPIAESIELALDDDMDFLREDATLNLHNPQIQLRMGNTMGVPVDVKLHLCAKDAAGNLLPGTRIPEIPVTLKAAEKDGEVTYTKILISKQGTQKEGYETKKVAELSDLLTVIPDLIAIDMTASANNDQLHRVNLDSRSQKNITAAYDVVVPLHFEELKIHYVETINGLLDDLKDFAGNQEEITLLLKTKVANTIPLDLELNVEGYDADRNKIEGIHSQTNAIKAGDGTAKPVITELSVKILVKKGALPDLDMLDLRIAGTATQTDEGVALRDEQFVQMNQISLTVLGGITISNNK